MERNIGFPSRYKIESHLGSGGIGTVFRAADTQLGRTVALKVLNEFESDAKESITEEFKILSRLSHPCLVQVLDFGFCENGAPYFSMEYIDGPDLKNFFSSRDAINKVPTILADVLSALHYLDSQKIVHGDIKPENILVRSSGTGRSVLVDFGLSSITGHKAERVSGTLRFLAPEVLSDRRYSTQSDLYALGRTLIECMTEQISSSSLNITEEHLRQSYEMITDLLNQVGLDHPANLALLISEMAKPTIHDRIATPLCALQRLRALKIAREPASLFSEETYVERISEEVSIRGFLLDDHSTRRTLLLEGPSGSGKRTLMRKAAEIAQLNGNLIIDMTGKVEFTVDSFLEILASNLSPHESEELITKHHDILNKLKRAETPSEMQNVNIIYDNVAQSIDRISTRAPVLILLSDIESQNHDFIGFLEQLNHELALFNSKAKWIISKNTDVPISQRLQNFIDILSQRQDTNIVSVSGLTNEEYRVFFNRIFQERLFTEEELRILYLSTRGLPRLIVEFLVHLLNSEIVTHLGDSFHIDRSRLVLKPIDQEEYLDVSSYFERLSQDHISALQILTNIESGITTGDAEHLLGVKDENIIQDCIRLGFLEIENDKLRISSRTYSRYLISSLSQKEAEYIHGQIANFLESRGNTPHTQIATHYIASNNPEKAFHHGLLAVNTHLKNHEYYSCRTLLLDLLKLARCHREQLIDTSIVEKLSDVNMTLGLIEDALTGYTTLLEGSKDVISKAKYENRLGYIYYSCLGKAAEAKVHYSNAMSFLGENGDPTLLADTMIALGIIDRDPNTLLRAAEISEGRDEPKFASALSNAIYFFTMSGDSTRLHSTLNELERHLDSSNADTLRAIYYAQAMAAFYTGDYSTAISSIDKLLAVVDLLGDETRRIYYMSVLGSIYFVQGQYLQQIDILASALQRIRKYRAYSHVLTVLANLSLGYIYLSLYRDSINCIEIGIAEADTHCISEIPVHFYSSASRAYSIFGEGYNEIRNRMLSEHKRIATESNNRISLGHLSMREGDIEYWNLEHSTALENYRKAAGIFQSTNTRDDNVEALLKSALCLIGLGEFQKATEVFGQAEVEFEAIGCNYLLPLYWYVKGLLESREGKGSPRGLLTALNVSSRQGTRETTWQIQRALARHYLGDGNVPEASKHFKGAVGTLRQITETFQDDDMVRSYLNVPIRRRLFEEIRSLRERI